jgi:uncharacterized protein YndB with AHSA1/START domain
VTLDAKLPPGSEPRPSVTVRRRLPMHRDELFKLWTDPAHLARWWGPVGWRVTRCEVDLRPDGTWNTWLLTGRGDERSIGGRYIEISPPDRLVFTWNFPAGAAGGDPQLTVVTVQFIKDGDGTELHIEHQKLTTGQAVDMDVGWTSTLDSLAQYIDSR